MKYANRPTLVRLALIDEQLRAGKWPNASSLAQDLDVTPRTIHRDFDFLREQFHAPLTFDPQHNGYAYSDATFRLTYLSLSEGEYLALFLAERLVREYRDTPYAEDLHRLFEKISGLLADPITIDLQHLAGSFSFRHATFTSEALGIMGKIHAALHRRLRLEISYQSMTRKEPTSRLIDPYHLASLDGEWNLIAYCHLRKDVRTFLPSRIRELRETETTFEVPKTFDVKEYFSGAFRKMRGDGPQQKVRLRFAASAARYIRERVWHPTQELHEQADGSLTMTFRVSHLLEVKRWVLSFGSECEVLGPRELKQELRHEIRLMLNQFDRGEKL